MSKTIVRNISANWICYFITVVINLVLAPYIVKHLGIPLYGVWIIINSFVGYFGLFDMGVSASVMRFVALYDSQKKQEKVNEIVSVSFFFFLILSVLVSLAIVAFYFILPLIFKIDASFLPIARFLLIIVGVNIVLSFPFGVFAGVLRGIQRFDVANIIAMFALVLRAFAIVVFIKYDNAIYFLAIITLISNVFRYVMHTFCVFRFRPKLVISLIYFKLKVLKEITGYGFSILVIKIADKIILYTDRVVIGIFLGPASVAFYSVGNRLVEYMRELITEATCVVGANATTLIGQGKNELLKQRVINVLKYTVMLSLFIGFSLFFLGKDFLLLWMGPDFAEKSTPVLKILAIAEILISPASVGAVILMALNKHQKFAVFMCVEAFSNLILSILLLKYYGIIGVAIGTIVPVIPRFIFLLFYISKEIECSIGDYFVKSIALPVFATGSALFSFCCFTQSYTNDTFFKLIIAGLLFAFLCLLNNLVICFSREERNDLVCKLKMIVLKSNVGVVLGKIKLLYIRSNKV